MRQILARNATHRPRDGETDLLGGRDQARVGEVGVTGRRAMTAVAEVLQWRRSCRRRAPNFASPQTARQHAVRLDCFRASA